MIGGATAMAITKHHSFRAREREEERRRASGAERGCNNETHTPWLCARGDALR